MTLLEVCIDTLESAIAAESGGADRLELCKDLSVGGLTPSVELALQVIQATAIPCMMMVRPRGGNFVYSTAEFARMKKAVILAHKLELKGVVFGLLLPDGHIDVVRTTELVALARPMQVTFHRAFDECADPFLALKQLQVIGVDRILTSGQKAKATDAPNLLSELVVKSKGRPVIMPGSGINSTNIAQLHHVVKAAEYHGSFKEVGSSCTSESEVRRAVETLESRS